MGNNTLAPLTTEEIKELVKKKDVTFIWALHEFARSNGSKERQEMYKIVQEKVRYLCELYKQGVDIEPFL